MMHGQKKHQVLALCSGIKI